MLPESVEGGAIRSGFCWAISMSVGPMIGAPRSFLIGCPLALVSPIGQRIVFGSVPMKGTVAVESAAEAVAVP